MKTYDNEPCGGPKQRWCSLKQCPDFVQFAVNEDSQRLKCSGSRVNMFHWRDGRSYDPGQLRRGCNRPPSHNGSGDCPRPPFLTVFVNEIRQLALARLIHHLFGGGLGSRIHSHIQRPVRLKTKPSSRLVELQAAYAEVGQQAIGRSRRYVRGDAAERIADETHLRRLAAELLANPREPGPGQLKRLGIALKADQASRRSQLPDDAFSMSRQAERAVDDGCAGPHAQKLQHFIEKNRHMACLRLRHASPPEGLTSRSGGGKAPPQSCDRRGSEPGRAVTPRGGQGCVPGGDSLCP